MLKIRNENIGDLYDFIVDTHKQITNEYDEVVEIRALRSDKGNKRAYRSFTFYDDTPKQKEYFIKNIESLDNKDIPYCLFYSVFSFVSGEKKSKRINNVNSSKTSILVADFDNITMDQFVKELERFEKVEAYPSYTISSGHGYQCVWLLEEPTNDKDILNKWTRLLSLKGFKVDQSIKDCARVMRLPYTYNTKDNIKKGSQDEPIQIETKVLSANKKRYSLERLFMSVNTLESINTLETAKSNEIKTFNEEHKEDEEQKKDIERDYKTYNLKEIYPIYKGILTQKFINELPSQQKAVLYHGFQNNYANAIVTQMTLFLRDYKGLSIDKIKDIILRIATVNKEYKGSYTNKDKIISNIERYYNSDYKFNGKVLSVFGKFGGHAINDVLIDNYLFSVRISNKAFYIYVRLSIQVRQELKKQAYRNTFTMNDIEKLVNTSARRIKPKLDELIKNKLMYVKKGQGKKGATNTYHLNPYIKQHGYTTFTQEVITNFINALNDKTINETSLRILLFIKYQMKKMESIGANETLISQETIGKYCNCTQQGISSAFKKIEDLNQKTDLLGNEYMYVTRNLAYIGNNKACYEFIISY